ncbi:MAG: hypothetical protein H6Q54_432 [Deltaproteobacteria bacterium]|jgi:hypothetical protein|nr:hypothetical protein [Deltaproteobacteria bacterium]
MEIVIMKHNWEEFEKGNAAYLRALNGEEINFYNRLGESLVELNVVETNKLASTDKYMDYMTQWLNTAYNVVNLPQKLMLNWLSTVHKLGHSSKG